MSADLNTSSEYHLQMRKWSRVRKCSMSQSSWIVTLFHILLAIERRGPPSLPPSLNPPILFPSFPHSFLPSLPPSPLPSLPPPSLPPSLPPPLPPSLPLSLTIVSRLLARQNCRNVLYAGNEFYSSNASMSSLYSNFLQTHYRVSSKKPYHGGGGGGVQSL